MIGRLCKRLLWLVVLSGITGALVYVVSGKFSGQWRAYLVAQLEQRGVFVDFDRLSLNIVGGVGARGVRVFNDEGREQLLMSMDRVDLDFDYGKLIKGEVVINGLELASANVALPVDPEHPELTVVEVQDIHARVYLRDRHLKIAQAEGELAGVRLSVTADLVLPVRPTTAKEKEEARTSAMNRLKVVREYRNEIQKGLDWLGRFEFKVAPTLTVALRGETMVPEAFEAELAFAARDLGYRGYVCEELTAEAAYQDGVVDLRKLRMVDSLGSLEAQATWRRGENEVGFRVTSSADLTAVADALLGSSALREVVFYDQGPSFALEGRWFFGEKGAGMKRPVDVRGEIQCPRFTSRGEVFEGLSASFGVSEEGIYVRDGLVRHRTGSLGIQFMVHEQQGLRYRAILKMDPVAFKPFVVREQERDLIDRFKFERDASIYVKLEGNGPTTRFEDCRNIGRGEMRGMAHQGVPFVKVEGDFEFQGPELIFRNVKGEREDGLGEVDEVVVQLRERWVSIKGARSKCDPVPILLSFVPNIAEVVARYQLPSETLVNVDGVFGWREGADKTDCRVGFAAVEGTGIYRLLDKDYQVVAPQGELLFKRDELAFEVFGKVYDGPLHAKGKTDLSPERDEFEVLVKLDRFRYPIFGEPQTFERITADVRGVDGEVGFDVAGSLMGGPMTAKGRASGAENYDAVVTVDPFQWPIFGKVLAFREGRVDLKNRAGVVAFDSNAKLMSGEFVAKGEVDTTARTLVYKGDMGVNALSFKEFSKTYTPAFETEGDLTGHVKFSGEFGNWETLKGEGVAIIVNSNLYAVPILGPLTPLLGGFLPAPIKGYNVAKEANCTFTIQDGFVFTEDVEALTTTFRLVAKGNANFIKDEVEFDAQARIRGLPGIVLRPVSELLEYQARGTIGDPAWKPRLLNFGSRATTEAEKTDSGEMPVEEAEEKRRLRLPNLFRSGSGGAR